MLEIILKSIAIVGGLGLIFGLGLGIASKKLAVEKIETISDIIELLPGANCGGCGYPGCEAFAKALYEKKAEVTDCSVCSSASTNKIAEILGVEVAGGKRMVARVMCVGVKDKIVSKYIYGGLQDCRAAMALAGGAKACSVGCLGLGTCQSVCKFDAITIDKKDGVAVVDEDKCVGCGACAEACPKNTITMMDPELSRVYVACRIHQKGKAVTEICQAGCIGCGICANVCKFGAITMVNNLPVIDHEKCKYCGLCAKKCPKEAIKFIKKKKVV